MITPESPGADVGTQPANFDELDMESVATMRPMSTQAIFRPRYDDETSVASTPIEAEEMQATVSRTLVGKS